MVASFKRVEYHGQFFDVWWNRIYKNSCHLEYFLKETAGRIMTSRRCWHNQLSLSFEFQNSNEQTLWGQHSPWYNSSEAQSAEHTEFGQKHVIGQCMFWWVGGSFSCLSIQGLYTKDVHAYLAPRWLKKQLMMFLFQCPFAGILLLSERGSKLWKVIGVQTNFQTLPLECVSPMSWSAILGLNIPQIWILSRSKFCIELQVEQYRYLDSQTSKHVN